MFAQSPLQWCMYHQKWKNGNAFSIYVCSWVHMKVSHPYLSLFCLCLWMHIHTTTAASMIIPISTTIPTAPPTPSPTPPPTSVISTLLESVTAVDLSQSAWAVNEATSIGQLGSTLILLLWTTIDVWPPLIHCWIYDSTRAQSECPDSCARYKTTCWSLVQRKCSFVIWFTVNEHWHLELTADIMELVMSAIFSLVLWNCKAEHIAKS